MTEIIYALGLSDRIVAVDSTSYYPEEATSKPNVGYMRRLAAEPILALEPSMVLAIEDAGPPAVLDQIREAGLPVVLIPDLSVARGRARQDRAPLPQPLGEEEKGRTLTAHLKVDLEALSTAVARLPVRPRVLFLLSIGGGGAPLAAGAQNRLRRRHHRVGRGRQCGGMLLKATSRYRPRPWSPAVPDVHSGNQPFVAPFVAAGRGCSASRKSL